VKTPRWPRPCKMVVGPLLALCLITPLVVRAIETPRETQLHQMSQLENSNKTVTQFLKGLDVPFKSDTVYAFIVPPMTAARIEGGINPFIRLLRKAGVKTDIVTLAVSSRKRAAQKYLQRRAFTSDYSLAVDTAFLKSFVFSAGILEVPFVTKFSVSTGEMLSSYSLMGTVDSTTAAWFVSDISKPKEKRPAVEKPTAARVRTDAYKVAATRLVRLVDTEAYPLSMTYSVAINPSGTRLAYWDKLTYYVYVFDLNTGELVNALHPDSNEEMTFISVPPPVYQTLKQFNIVNPMYLDESFCDDTTLLVSASLPSISMKVTDNDTNIAVNNSPVLIRKTINSNVALGYVSFKPLPESVKGGYTHSSPSFVNEEGLIFLPFIKGWPSGSQLLDEKTPPEDNPYSDEFYRRDIYQFASFDTAGRFTGLWGSLSPRLQALRLGYVSHGGLVRSHDDKYYLCDQCSGTIFVYDKTATLKDSVRVFEEQPTVDLGIDRYKEPERYLLETFRQNFRARVVDFLVTDDYLYALLLWDENQPVVYKVGLRNQRPHKYALPSRFEGKEVKHYLLRQTPSGIVTVSLPESGDQTWYCEFKVP
jgi:hypothetical protein